MKAFSLPDSTLYGIKALDDQHQELIDVIRSLSAYAGSDDLATVEKIFNHIQEILIEHFDDEEQVMRDLAYPDMDSHSIHHRGLLEETLNIFSLVRTRGRLLDSDISESLDKIIRHLLEFDGPFNTYLYKVQAHKRLTMSEEYITAIRGELKVFQS